jgi:hypothetical protein
MPSMPNPYEVPFCQETNDTCERFFLFAAFRVLAPAAPRIACPDFLSICRCRANVAAPHTYCGSIAVEVTSAEASQGVTLCGLETISVPSYRPTQNGGRTCQVRQ